MFIFLVEFCFLYSSKFIYCWVFCVSMFSYRLVTFCTEALVNHLEKMSMMSKILNIREAPTCSMLEWFYKISYERKTKKKHTFGRWRGRNCEICSNVSWNLAFSTLWRQILGTMCQTTQWYVSTMLQLSVICLSKHLTEAIPWHNAL